MNIFIACWLQLQSHLMRTWRWCWARENAGDSPGIEHPCHRTLEGEGGYAWPKNATHDPHQRGTADTNISFSPRKNRPTVYTKTRYEHSNIFVSLENLAQVLLAQLSILLHFYFDLIWVERRSRSVFLLQSQLCPVQILDATKSAISKHQNFIQFG